MKIVLIDDDSQVTSHFASLIQNEGHNLVIVNDPSKAIYSIVSFKPDLVFIDFLMPTINGIDVMKRVRSIPGFSEVNIYFMVHEEDELYYESTDTKGVQGYITKPLNDKEISTVIVNKFPMLIPNVNIPNTIVPVIDSVGNGSDITITKYDENDSAVISTETPIFSTGESMQFGTSPLVLHAAMYDILTEEVLPKFETMTSLLRLLHQNLSSLPKSLIAESIERTLSSASTLNEYIKDLQVLSIDNISPLNNKISLEELKDMFEKTIGTVVKIPEDFYNIGVSFEGNFSEIEKVFIAVKKYFKDLSVDYTIDMSISENKTELRIIFSFLPKNDIVVTIDSETSLLKKLTYLEQIAPTYLQLHVISTTLHFYLSL